LLILVGRAAFAAGTVDVPVDLGPRIATIESTRLDIGEPRAVFDRNERTLVRTPAINPLTMTVTFKEPVSASKMRVLLTEDEHEVTIYIAGDRDGLARAEPLILRQRTRRGEAIVPIPAGTRVGAMRLVATRLTGDDFVHLFEWQFLEPAKVEGVRIERVVDRREPFPPNGRVAVDGPINTWLYTVVALRAFATAGGAELDVTDKAQWQVNPTDLAPFLGRRNELQTIRSGRFPVLAVLGEQFARIEIEAKERPSPIPGPDIEVALIERTPRMPFDGPNGGLPKEGGSVVWRARVLNTAPEGVPVRYTWTIDGRVVDQGVRTIPPTQPGTLGAVLELPWTWSPARHRLTLEVQPEGDLDELIEANDRLSIDTDAVTVGLWVERSLWDYMMANQHKVPSLDANSFAGWGQRMIRKWNQMFEEAVFDRFPQGITERVRLDQVVIVPDFALPLAGGLPSNNPDNRDRTVDMAWGCESVDIQPGFEPPKTHWWSVERAVEAWNAGRIRDRREDPPFWVGLGYIHELNHARYLVDSYGFNVHASPNPDPMKTNIRVTDEKGPILGRYIPADLDMVYVQRHSGQMGGDYWSFSVYDAMCWERVRGQRARGGNTNAPPTIGEFLQEIPARIIFQFEDPAGRPLAGAELTAYRARGTGQGWYTKVFEDEPVWIGATDSRGRVTTDRTLFSADGRIVHTFGHSNAVVLLRVTYQGQHYFMFESVQEANLAANLVSRDEFVFRRIVRLRTGEPNPAEWSATESNIPEGERFDQRPPRAR
jgi:hypothetical protein